MVFEERAEIQTYEGKKIFVLCPRCGAEALYYLPKNIAMIKCISCGELIRIHEIIIK